MRIKPMSMLAVLALMVGLLASAAGAAPPPGKGGGNGGGGGGGGETTGVPVPSSMASLGDSITRAFNACGFFFDCTGRSWSTGGGNDAVDSHAERLAALDSAMSAAYNEARTGATVDELPGQAADAVSRGAGYVTILIGANDACTDSVDTMTDTASFGADVDAALAILDPDARDVQVFVSSIPDVYQLWQVGKDSSSARAAWSAYGICQSLLDNPRSTDQADVQRREAVRARVEAFNAELAEACADYVNCHDDGGAVFGYEFQLSQLSGWDYFHPNESGQAVLAEVTWSAAGIDWLAATKGKGGGKKK